MNISNKVENLDLVYKLSENISNASTTNGSVFFSKKLFFPYFFCVPYKFSQIFSLRTGYIWIYIIYVFRKNIGYHLERNLGNR